MAKQVFLDMSEAATRSAILSQLEEAMDELAYAEYTALVEEALASPVGTDACGASPKEGPSQLSLASAQDDHHAHTLADVHEVIDGWSIPEDVRQALYQVYEVLAEAEGSVHGAPADQVHFHEVGKIEALRNALKICAAFHVLSAAPSAVIEQDAPVPSPWAQVTATPVQTGKGTVLCAHGEMPVPAPATKAILEAHAVPTQETLLEGELCTPTSAALLVTFVQAWTEKDQ